MNKFSIFIAVCTFILTACNTSNSNELYDTFEKDIQKYCEVINEKKYEEMMDMLNPRLFDFMNREDLIKAFEGIREKGVIMTIGFDDIERVSEIIEHNDALYARIYYDGFIEVNFEERGKPSINAYLESMSTAYGEDNVTYNAKKEIIFVDTHKSMLAMLVKGDIKWKYFEYNEAEREFLAELLPRRVLEALQ